MTYQCEDDACMTENIGFRKTPGRGLASRRRTSGQSDRKSRTFSNGISLAQAMDTTSDASPGMHSLAHELAFALMPEPSAESKLLQEEFDIEYGEGAEGIDGNSGQPAVDGAQTFADELNEHTADGPQNQIHSFVDELRLDGSSSRKRSETQKSEQRPLPDPIEVLARDLESTDRFISQLQQLDSDASLSSSSIEKLASDVIRHINDTVRDREGQLRELLECEREFRKIAGEVNGNEVLGRLDALEEVEDLMDNARSSDVPRPAGRQLETVKEEPRGRPRAFSNDWETNPDDLIGDNEDTVDDEVDLPSPMKDSFVAPPPTVDSPTISNMLSHLSHVRTLTTSLASSLTAMSEHAQVNGAANADTGRRIRALKNKLGEWRSEWESAERSRIRIERWEAGLPPDGDNCGVKTPSRASFSSKRVDARRVVEEHLRAFELSLSDAAAKTRAIMARS